MTETETEPVAKTDKPKASLDDVTEAMKDVVDPELGINVVDLGLVYGVHVDDERVATIDMTLTSAACPLTDVIGINVLARLDGPEVRRGDACAPCDDVRKGFVHAQCRTLDVAAYVGYAGELQQPLDRAVLAEPAMQYGKHHVQPDRSACSLLQDQ